MSASTMQKVISASKKRRRRTPQRQRRHCKTDTRCCHQVLSAIFSEQFFFRRKHREVALGDFDPVMPEGEEATARPPRRSALTLKPLQVQDREKCVPAGCTGEICMLLHALTLSACLLCRVQDRTIGPGKAQGSCQGQETITAAGVTVTVQGD